MNIMAKTFPVPCTKEEMAALIDASIDDDFYYTLFMVAKTTGRRLGELYNVQVKDFIPEKNILITKVLKRKRPVEKEAILTSEVSRILNRFIKSKQMKMEDFIFQQVSYRNIQYRVKGYAKKAGIPHNVSFHNFRHYLITELVRQGWSYDKIAKLTGHISVGTLVNYDHAVASDIKEDAMKALESI